ncbi:MAG: tyrosine-protein phosphatase [Acidimicrobiales bacterium]
MVSEGQRHVELQGCCNFRDLGGYRSADGRTVAWGRVYRADGLTQLTESDMALLTGRGLRNVVDLRTEIEVQARGRFPERAPAIAYRRLPLTDTLPGGEEMPEWDDAQFVVGRYFGMLSGGTAALRGLVELLCDSSELPLVYHCSVGKDRTGVVSAVVLGLLGVPDDVIVSDYVLSAEPMKRVLERFRAEYPDNPEITDRYAPVILSVDARSMEGLLQRITNTYGGFEGLAEMLGVTALVPRLRETLLSG